MEKTDHGTHGTTSRTESAQLLHAVTSGIVAASFFSVYRELGWGFVEHVYQSALAFDLSQRGVPFEREKPIRVYFRGSEMGRFRADLVVDGIVLVEVKTTNKLANEHEKQILNYLRATRIEVGLLLNFGPRPLFKRYVLTNDRKRSQISP